jgi:hypothetical protein
VLVHRLVSPPSYYSDTGFGDATSFRAGAMLRHKAQNPAAGWARNCDLRTLGSIAEICDALAAKTDIDWF